MKRKVSFLIWSVIFFVLVFLSLYIMLRTGGFVFYIFMGIAIFSIILGGVFIGFYLSSKKTPYDWRDIKNDRTIEIVEILILSDNNMDKLYNYSIIGRSRTLAFVYIENWGGAMVSLPDSLSYKTGELWLKRKDQLIKIKN